MEILQIRDLSFEYPHVKGYTRALSNINISIAEGEFVVICGESGSGKSTLLKLLKPEIAPAGKKSGEILFRNAVLDNTNSIGIGYMGQDYELSIVTDRVYQELAFGPENLGLTSENIRSRVSEVSSYFGMDEWLNSPTDKLSGGQKQILSLAAVLTMRPRVILLDEPMGSLDPVSCDRLMGMLRRINTELGITILMVEHALSYCMDEADRLVVLKNGSVLYDGEPASSMEYVRDERIFEAFPVVARLVDRIGIQGWDRRFNVRSGIKLLSERAYREVDRKTFTPDKSHTVLSAKDIYFAYERKSPFIVRGADLSVYGGTRLAILGGNGSGKSTFIKALAGINRVVKGKVKSSGRIAYLPQDSKLAFLGDSVRSDYKKYLDYMGFENADSMISQVTEELGIGELLDMHPYDLSGGQRALAAMGKIIMSNTDIWLLDEPTQGLDMGMKRVLSDIFKRMAEGGKTIVFVTHDTVFAQMASDMACMFFDGRPTEACDTHEFLMENNFYTTPARLIAGDRAKVTGVDELIQAYT